MPPRPMYSFTTAVVVAATVAIALLPRGHNNAALAYEFSPDWTVEIPLPYTRELAQAFLTAHNIRRAAPPHSAANMHKLTWNASLALQAKAHVHKCTFAHDTLNNSVGQTLFAGGTHELNVDKANETLFAWVERDLEAHPMSEEGAMTLNFASQILWADTTSVGCASQWCPNQIVNAGSVVGVLTVCNYYPPGNYRDRKVFKIGPPCTECPDDAMNCDGTLCTAERYMFESRSSAFDPSVMATASPSPVPIV